jgi:hypothetical protein
VPSSWTAPINSNSGAGIVGGAVVIDDSGDPANATYTINDSTVQINNAPPITYSGAQSLTVRGGSGVDTFNVQGLSTTTPVTLDAGAGTSAINVGAPGDTLEPLAGSLTINGAGLTTVTFNNQGADAFVNYTDAWSAHHVDFTNNAHIGSVLGVDFSDVAAMTVNDAGGATNDAHVFDATPAVGTLTIHGAAGFPDGASSDYIQALAPTGGTNDWCVTGFYRGALNGVVAFDGVDALLTGSSGADFFHFLPGGHMLEVAAEGNDATLDFSQFTPGITVDLPDASGLGSVPGVVQVLATNPVLPTTLSIIGTAGNDTYRFPTGASIGGTISGGGGSDTLDYSGYKGDIQVNLLLGTATGVGGGISGIENVIGSIGNDLIVGDANANTLIGGTGRNVLIGGAGSDTLDASLSSGDNLVIGGTTAYDNNPAALDAIFAEWVRTDLSFRDRYSDLTSGTNGAGVTPLNQVNGQPILLTPTTVHADTSPDTLTGSNQTDPATGKRVHNWFFYDDDDVLVNYLSSSDHKTKEH